MTSLARRSWLRGACAAAVIAFDPLRRSWITRASAAPALDPLCRVPVLDGELLCDPASLTAAADDFGHIIHRRPTAVLRPGSVRDIVAIVRFAREQRMAIAARGQGHATFGQAQVAAGIVIDSSSLATVHAVTATDLVVDAGATWREVVDAALALGLAPPTLPDYLDLSVGGTLSGGGMGGAAHRHGAQIDNVLALDVVTGTGELLRCSPGEHPELFGAVLGGLGQFGIIVQARLRLIAVQPIARLFTLPYPDLATTLADLATLASDARFDHLEAQAIRRPDGGFAFGVLAASYTPGAPDDQTLLAGLSFDPAGMQIAQLPYADFVARIDPLIAAQIANGEWQQPHPWLDLFIPGSAAGSYLASALAALPLSATGDGPIVLYPLRRSKLRRPFLRVPDEELCFLFDVLRTAPADPAIVQAQLAANRALYQQARSLGGTRYCIGSIPFTPTDWHDHFGAAFGAFRDAKRAFDPDHILTPGQGIFRDPDR